MVKRCLLFGIFLLFFCNGIFSLTIYWAPVKQYANLQAAADNENTELHIMLIKKMETWFANAKLNFKALNSSIETPVSFMDAMRVCSTNSIDYLIYGFIEYKEFAVNAELKLFDSLKQEVVQVFYASDNRNQVPRLLDDLAAKIAQYFAVTTKQALQPSEGIVALAIGGGYWMPLTTQWSDSIQALYSGCFALRFIPWRPAEWGLYFKTGLTGNFYHSINKSGFEGLNLYTVTAGIPFYLCLDMSIRHTISLGVEPQFAFDYLVREPLYNEVLKTFRLFFSSDVNLEYQFHITKYVSFIVGNKVLLQFFNVPRIVYNPQLMFEVNTKPLIRGAYAQ